jgi:hypothetical protein
MASPFVAEVKLTVLLAIAKVLPPWEVAVVPGAWVLLKLTADIMDLVSLFKII